MKKKFALLSLFALLFFSVFAHAATLPCHDAANANTFGLPCVFYGGDVDTMGNFGVLANETDAIVNGSPYGAATFQNFEWGGGQIAGLFTNNFSNLTPTSAYYEIRQYMSEGNGGTLIDSGTIGGSNFAQNPTGRSGLVGNEYTDAVRFSPINLPAGMYWFAVVPEDLLTQNGGSFEGDTLGLNSIGTQSSNLQFFNSPFFGKNYENANDFGSFPTFSSGVLGPGVVPEPPSMIMLGSGLLGVVAYGRRRLGL